LFQFKREITQGYRKLDYFFPLESFHQAALCHSFPGRWIDQSVRTHLFGFVVGQRVEDTFDAD
jgi:hypothetical protein